MGTLTLRLPPQLETQLNTAIEQENLSRSELVRQAIESYLAQLKHRQALNKMVQQAEALTPQDQAEMVTESEQFEGCVSYEDEGVWWK